MGDQFMQHAEKNKKINKIKYNNSPGSVKK